MSRKSLKIWSSDWFSGLVFCALFAIVAYTLADDFFYALDTRAYDAGMRLSLAKPSDRIAIVGIDDKSIEYIGRWPWSRDVMASGIEQLASGGAKVIASTVFLSEPQLDPGLDVLRDLKDQLRQPGLATVTDNGEPPEAARELAGMASRIDDALATLDYDGLLATSIDNAGNVALPLQFEMGVPIGRPDQPQPAYVTRHTIANALEPESAALPPPASRLFSPVPSAGAAAQALGHLMSAPDRDGAVRSEWLAVDYYGDIYPSLALSVAALSLNLDPGDIQLMPDSAVRLGNLEIRTARGARMLNYFYDGNGTEPAFPADSFYDVFTGQIPADKFRDKIVLIGASAAGIGDNFATPVSASMPPVQILAHTVSSILEQHYVTRPGWAPKIELGAMLLVAAYIVIVLPLLRAGMGAFVSAGLFFAIVGIELVLLVNNAQWVRLMVPAAFLLVGHLVITVRRFRVTERLKLHSDADSAESNKMLGLAFQSQGQLDMAFEKFRRCPLSDGIMDPLYNLALDYERKRMFNKAGAVYAYMSEYDPDYRDLKARLRRSQTVEETLILGAGSGGGRPTLLLDGEGVAKPMLGRYQVEKEIGKGAMGTVYLGRDPKINRVVAIKTIALSEEFEDEELENAKARFFREAETAGRLNHPDIVTVYDAGEEDDLAYIAMEYLRGQHLNGYTRSKNLLPADTVIGIMSRAANALDYAHRESVVHRDIKPANIMYDPDSDEIKITDFGIARLTDCSKTKTGIVLGTPSYMSPEQLSGKNVTGRSDLFSLGVTLYQLLAGQLPFRADSMATLMFKIANDPHTPLSVVRPDLPPCLEAVITKALEKDADDRYQTGGEMARDLLTCAGSIERSGTDG